MSDDPVEQGLLEAIAVDFTAIEPRRIYADWLQARNDPRGDLFVIQHARQSRPDDVELCRREAELLQTLAAVVMAEARRVNENVLDVTRGWYLGFVDKLELDAATIRKLRTSHRAWLAHPAFHCVRALDVRSRFARNLRFLRDLPELAASVRRLQFGDAGHPLHPDTLAAIVRELPALEHLELRASVVPVLTALAKLPLTRLSLRVDALDSAGVTRIREAAWPLEALALRVTRPPLPEVHPELATVFDGSVLRTVRHLEIGGAMPMIEVIEALALSKRIETLETLGGEWDLMPYDATYRTERHRAALASIRLVPLLGRGAYYDPTNWQRLGSLLNHRLERPADALAAYRSALELNPSHQDAQHGLGISLRKLGRHDESLVAFDLLIDQARRPTAQMYNGRHYTLCALGRRGDALADLERAVVVDPNFADAWNNLGCERQHAGDGQGALAAFRRTMQLDADHGYGRRNEGEILLELGLAGEALPIFTELLARAVDDPWLLTLQGQAQLEIGDAAGARATLDRRLRDPAVPNRARAFVLRALAARALGDEPAALRDLADVARETDCPAWIALLAYLQASADPAGWTRVVPDSALGPDAITDAVLAHAAASRPADAVTLHDADTLDRLDCAQLCVLATLRAGNRDLARWRGHALATHLVAQGPRFHRRWWHTLGAVVTLTTGSFAAQDRALADLVLRGTRGRRPIAELLDLTR